MRRLKKACKKASIKPILGVNASIMFNDDLIHLALYARDDVGYKDLVRIVSDINLNENKAITLKALSNYRDHLYVVSHEYEDRLIEKEATSKEDLLTHAQIESPVLSFMKIMKKLFGASSIYLDRYLMSCCAQSFSVTVSSLIAMVSYSASASIVCFTSSVRDRSGYRSSGLKFSLALFSSSS